MPEQDFLNELHEIDDFRPFDFNETAGRFDVRMRIAAGYININVKIYFDFGFLFLGTTGMTASRFRKKYKKQIQKYWDGRFRLFAQDARGKKHYFTPNITFTEVHDRDAAHFVANIKRLHVSTSYVQRRDRGAHTCVLYSDAVKSRPKGPITKLGWRATLGGTREALVMNQTREDLAEVERLVGFRRNEATISGLASVTTIVETYRQNMATRPLVRLRLTGLVVDGEDRGLALRRAEALARELYGRGFPGNLLLVEAGGTGPAPCVRVTLDEASLQEILDLPNDFPIAAHEFGHKLGLLDEYIREGVDTQNSPEGLAILGMAHRLLIPVPKFDSNTISLMSVGDKVLPFHYLPFVAAAEEIRTQWRQRTGIMARMRGDLTLRNGDVTFGIDQAEQAATQVDDEPMDLGQMFGE